ncbi:MAG TPA: nucleotide disphospho-sugar-binding domain-containing protein [Acidimicrobiales bacterium]|nr:nucleotide disphospho-sugar-binding domain-containing protein [Acidimicrobiales bacterium]
MGRFVVACTPLHGHVTPLLAVTAALTARGHEVVVCTGARFAGAVEAAGATHRPLPGPADFDDRRLEAEVPERGARGRIARVNADIRRLLADRLPAQHVAVAAAVAEVGPDAVVVDSSFLGGITWRLGSASPPLAVVNVTFLTLGGRGVPPAGVGLAWRPGVLGGLRDRAVRQVTDRVVVRPGLRALDAAATSVLGAPVPGMLFDGPGMADLLLVATVAGFEHPRSDLPAHVRYVGPLAPPAATGGTPPWWGDLDGRRVVHVTQGTMDTADPGRLLAPTLAALAADDVVVVASTGGRPVAGVTDALGGPLPANARVVPFVPYADLLPRVDVMVTNGGFGGVQQALAEGVPLVCAGDGEDKPEVARRVARSGAGLDLRRGSPSSARIGRAVRTVLADDRYRRAAGRLASEMAATGGAAAAADEIEALADRGRRRR